MTYIKAILRYSITILLILLLPSLTSAISAPYVGIDNVDLVWSESESEDFVNYQLYRDGVLIVTITERMTTEYRAGDLDSGKDYTFRLVENRSDSGPVESSIDVCPGNVNGMLIPGDGNISSKESPVHNYTAAGNYTVSLTVANNGVSSNILNADYIPGSINCDFNDNGVVDIGDISKVAYMVADLTPVDLAADFNDDGKVDVGDAAKIAYYFVGKISEPDSQFGNILDSYSLSDKPGVVVYVTGDKGTYSATAGLSDLEAKKGVSANDLFRIASATKSFVATVVLQLAEEGLIDLDAPIGNYLPEDIASSVANADEATVRDTLQMRSGIPDYMTDGFDDAVEDDPSHWWTAEEVVTYSYDIPPGFSPREKFEYCNNNYVLLQILIEKITGNPLADELENRIFGPVGMNSCYLESPENTGAGIVRGYEEANGKFTDVTMYNDGFGLGDGGIVGNAEDLAKFMPALMNGKFISSNTLSQMLQTVPDDSGDGYGLGIAVIDKPFGRLVGHDGSSGGFASEIYCLPECNTSIVVLTNNFDSEIAEEILFRVAEKMK
ncbi:serine hydrolase [Methanoplanus endosymbiosus]|uniref:Serine hydrolase n=1 Tax=Methanoplanus endosymbiosus TaxID=33865 RepID=A0A9E7PKU4_9EURY|nr:serine hydrolase [Methanoplanus endosymbiosus]UUX91750.1 serine hydrolase [Methanoplanus endosymbiosus]